MLAWGFILLSSLAWLGAALPIDSDVESQWLVRERRSPMAARTMILIRGQPSGGGYHYERPARAFNPHAGMSAYATGGTAAVGSFYRSPPKKEECEEPKEFVEAQPEAEEPAAPQEQEVPAQVDENKTPAVPVPERKPKAPKVPKRRPAVEEEEDDDDEDDSVAPKGGKSGGSVYKNFFPVTFGAAGRSRSRGAEDEEGVGEGGNGGSVTAIANSFSKGRGAIASSSAVAYGNPEASQTRQSQPSRYRLRA